MAEINLMSQYPQTKRNLDERVKQKSLKDKIIAKQFGQEFFDGDRRYGYGGFSYHPRFWTGVVKEMINYYWLTRESKILDVGCAKGFMLYDFKKAIPEITIRGIDVSEYAIKHSIEIIKPFLSVGDARDLSAFKDKEYDLVTSITTLHNLHIEECKKALQEVQRVGKNAFITLDAWKNDEQKERMNNWNLTAETYMHINDWKNLFKEVGYKGDYFWFIP
ncbi:MAG: class I SAM-dependent methyltransferase [Nanoarchaeota archaeon]|nr:class I SAM-dependent methyltransferase [Nanoarchaeota archaeon]